MHDSAIKNSFPIPLPHAADSHARQVEKLPKYDTLHLRRLYRCAPLRCTVENVVLGAWRRKERHLLFSDFNHEESEAPVRDDNFGVITNTLWRTMLFCLQKLTSVLRQSELVVVCANKFELRYNTPERDVEQHSSFCKPRVRTELQIVLMQACCRLVSRNFFIDVALVQNGNPTLTIRFQRVWTPSAQRASSPRYMD